MDECKASGIREEHECKEYHGAKARKTAEFDSLPEMVAPPSAVAAPAVTAAPAPPSFFSVPAAAAVATQQPSAGVPSLMTAALQGPPSPMTPMRGYGGYTSARIMPPCVDGRGGAINTDRMLIIDNEKVRNFFVTIEPLTAFEPCWSDRVDPVVIPIGGRLVSTFAVPEGGATTMMATIPVGCLNGSRAPSQCPIAPRLIIKAWRDLGPSLPPEYIGKWDATSAISGKLGFGPTATRLILVENVFHH
ncbi:hypothetical protein IT408_03575 [Candidatus Uhrbacteria bacterium]|nr:hypothetical protein [Candidatus Uhrbacteria bacterium]